MTYKTADATALIEELGYTKDALLALNACADDYVKHANNMVDAQLWTKQEAYAYLMSMKSAELAEDINIFIGEWNDRM